MDLRGKYLEYASLDEESLLELRKLLDKQEYSFLSGCSFQGKPDFFLNLDIINICTSEQISEVVFLHGRNSQTELFMLENTWRCIQKNPL